MTAKKKRRSVQQKVYDIIEGAYGDGHSVDVDRNGRDPQAWKDACDIVRVVRG
jgi:hypothetical protein